MVPAFFFEAVKVVDTLEGDPKMFIETMDCWGLSISEGLFLVNKAKDPANTYQSYLKQIVNPSSAWEKDEKLQADAQEELYNFARWVDDKEKKGYTLRCCIT